MVTFMKDALPGAASIDLWVANSHEPHFVSLTTGRHPAAPPLVTWDNDFGWSYGGNVTDSIKEKVKRAGGNVTGKVRVSLSRFNHDDLDLHVFEPNGDHIWYREKRNKLDVDMNAGGPFSREPVENVTWAGIVPDGEYRIEVNQYNKRESTEVGNRHYFFMLKGCVNDQPTRGIYNEFLRRDLQPHRKVFEVLGDRTRCEPSPDQLSGLGFSSTIRSKAVNAELKAIDTESFVATETNPARAALETKLEVVKHVIAVRLAEDQAAKATAAKKLEKEKLLAVLGRKQDAVLENLTEAELPAQVRALLRRRTPADDGESQILSFATSTEIMSGCLSGARPSFTAPAPAWSPCSTARSAVPDEAETRVARQCLLS